jgi:hypothetical protein
MKITTKKIIRELEKIGWELEPAQELLVIRVRDIIDEILTQQKNITIR